MKMKMNMKTLNLVRNMFCGVFGGMMAGRMLFFCFDHWRRPEYYAMQSSPWYTAIIGRAIITAIVFAVFFIVYFILGKIVQSKESEK